MQFNPIQHQYTAQISFIDYDTTEDLGYGNRCLTAIAIKKSYISAIYPLYVLTLNLTSEQRDYLSKNKFYISLKLYRCPLGDSDSANQETLATAPAADKEILSVLLRPFDPSKVFSEVITSQVNQDTNNQTNESQVFYEYVLNCVAKTDLTYNNAIVNACYEDANLDEIMINLVSDVYSGEIYMQESDNISRYSSLFVPPFSLSQALKYIQENYRIYTKYLNMFYDSNKLYIYDISNTKRTFRNTCDIEILHTGDDDKNKYRTPYMDDNENIIKYLDNKPAFISNKDTYRYTTGDQVVYTSYDSNFNLTTRNYNFNDSGNKNLDRKTRYLWNNYGTVAQEKNIESAFYSFTQISFMHTDPTIFNPDTKFIMTGATDTQFNGEYILIGSETYYTSNDFINFNSNTMLSLAKI